MTCKDCIHYDSCSWFGNIFTEEMADECLRFEDKSRYIELPCKVGDKVYKVYRNCISKTVIDLIGVDRDGDFTIFDEHDDEIILGYDAFLTREEAEKALKEQTK